MQYKTIDQLSKEECHHYWLWIGQGVRPITAARKFFPDRPAGYVNTTKNIRGYLINKYCALNMDLAWETRKIYIDICARIYIDLPQEAKLLEFIPLNCPNEYSPFNWKCYECESQTCPWYHSYY